MQDRTVNYTLGYDSQQFGMGDAVEVFRQVGIDDLGVALMERFCYFIDRIMWCRGQVFPFVTTPFFDDPDVDPDPDPDVDP